MTAIVFAAVPAAAQDGTLRLDRSDYFEAPGVNWLVFSNINEGLFADAKISGVELIQQGVRTATNGDVRLSATPGQWDETTGEYGASEPHHVLPPHPDGHQGWPCRVQAIQTDPVSQPIIRGMRSSAPVAADGTFSVTLPVPLVEVSHFAGSVAGVKVWFTR